jgi:hypothetical protein
MAPPTADLMVMRWEEQMNWTARAISRNVARPSGPRMEAADLIRDSQKGKNLAKVNPLPAHWEGAC